MGNFNDSNRCSNTEAELDFNSDQDHFQLEPDSTGHPYNLIDDDDYLGQAIATDQAMSEFRAAYSVLPEDKENVYNWDHRQMIAFCKASLGFFNTVESEIMEIGH